MSGTAIIVCGPGCCPGCQNCFGMGIGCHQNPCACHLPCVCKWAEEDENPRWRDGCERHDDAGDLRFLQPDHDINEDTGSFDGPMMNPCEVCGEWGPCAYDDEGRVLIHWEPRDDDALDSGSEEQP